MIIEQLLGSTTRYKLLSLFIYHRDKRYFVRELVRSLESHIHAVRRELAHLESLGIIHEVEGSGNMFDSANDIAKKKYYTLNPACVLLSELEALFAKDALMNQQDFIDKISNLGKVDYLLLSGIFVNDATAEIDILMVGSVTKERLEKACREYEVMSHHQLRYAVMTKEEFQYRRDVVDKFLYSIFEHKHVIAKDTIATG